MNFDFEKDNAARRFDREAAAVLENVELRDEAKEYIDESTFFFHRFRRLSVEEENEYLRETLDWERSPITPIADWFDSSWRPLDVASASDAEIAAGLLDLLIRLRRLNQEIWGADHLSNRRLYELIVRRLLPSKQKRLSQPFAPCVWNFAFYSEDGRLDASDDSIWLTYYATPEERRVWSQERDGALPQHKTPPFARRFPTFDAGRGGCDGCR